MTRSTIHKKWKKVRLENWAIILTLFALGACNLFRADELSKTVPKRVPDQRLKINLTCSRTWTPCLFGPEKAKKYPKVPQSISIFMTRETSGAVKPYILIKDSQGEIFQTLYMMNAAWHKEEGESRKVQAKFEFHKLSDVTVNRKVDPPVKLYALNFPCRAPTATSLELGPIAFDDVVVEDFVQDNGWHPVKLSDGVKLKLKRITSVTHRPRPGHPNEWKFPKHRTNLISGGTFEQGQGMPAGWHRGDAEYIPLSQDKKPVHDITKHDAVYQWEGEGVQSFRSISFEVTKQGYWGGVGLYSQKYSAQHLLYYFLLVPTAHPGLINTPYLRSRGAFV